jgi:hypothetical protein
LAPQWVQQAFEREADETLVLTFANGLRLEMTGNHPFDVEDQGSSRRASWGSGC